MINEALFNGQAPDASLVTSRGLHYGDGVFRTLMLHQGRLLDLDLQLDKLAQDCARLDLQVPPSDLLRSELLSLSVGVSAAVLKLVLMRKNTDRGYAPQTRECDRLILRYPPRMHPPELWTHGIKAQNSSFKLAAQPVLAGIKHLNRLEQVLASRDWPEGTQESILNDPEGHPLSGTRSNLFWGKAGELFTPDLSLCGVAGMMREKIIAQARAFGIQIHVQTRGWSELEQAEEVFVSNSLVGIWPVRALGPLNWIAPGPLTRRLMAALNHPQPD